MNEHRMSKKQKQSLKQTNYFKVQKQDINVTNITFNIQEPKSPVRAPKAEGMVRNESVRKIFVESSLQGKERSEFTPVST